MKLAACILSLAIALPASVPAVANDLVTRIQVTSAGLDLGHTADAVVMLRRLDRAAMSACGASGFSLREVKAAVRGGVCYRDSLERAVADLSAPEVSALYRESAAR